MRSKGPLFRPRLQNSHRADGFKRCEPFLKWLRGRPCRLEHTGECSGKIRACHVDYAGDKGMGTKVSDHFSIPMCDHHHDLQHRLGWASFEKSYRFNALSESIHFWETWLNYTSMGVEWRARRSLRPRA